MKKFIAAFDSLKFSTSTNDYAIQLAKENDAHLVGVFLEDFTRHGYKIYDVISGRGGGAVGSEKKKLDKKDAKTRAASIAAFEKKCKEQGITYSLHRDRSFAMQELLHESIYADLLIIDNTETLSGYTEKPPTSFIRELLIDVQCPVMVVPHTYKPIKKLSLLYDGEPSSVHAIKMFSYTLPALKGNRADIVSVNSPQKSMHLPDNKLIREFLQRHLANANFTVLKGIPETEIVSKLKQEKETNLVILGAYRRSKISRWFRESMADVLMREIKQPLFIAHNK